MKHESDTKAKVENPAAHFTKPNEVVKDDDLSQNEKKNALTTWEQDERDLLTASNEGMAGAAEGVRSEDDNQLGEVIRAKKTIDKK